MSNWLLILVREGEGGDRGPSTHPSKLTTGNTIFTTTLVYQSGYWFLYETGAFQTGHRFLRENDRENSVVIVVEIGKGAFASVTLGSDTSALGKQLMRPGTQSTSNLEFNRTFPLNGDLKDICIDSRVYLVVSYAHNWPLILIWLHEDFDHENDKLHFSHFVHCVEKIWIIQSLLRRGFRQIVLVTSRAHLQRFWSYTVLDSINHYIGCLVECTEKGEK